MQLRWLVAALTASVCLAHVSCAVDTEGRTWMVGRQQEASEASYARTLEPASITQPKRVDGPPRKLRARAHAEAEFARTTLEWQTKLLRQVERANQILIPGFGVELEIVEVKKWKAPSSDASLATLLWALAASDPADDVDVVIGLVTSLPIVTPTMHELGMAHVLGKHLVIRAMDDVEEYAALREVLAKLSDDERESLYRARLRHKEAAVLLHELGHLFGALHDEGSSSLMNDRYSNEASSFSEANAALIELVLAERDRLRDPRQRQAATDRLIAFFEAHADAEWKGRERAEMLGRLRGDPERLAKATDQSLEPKEGPKRRRDQSMEPEQPLDAAISSAIERAEANDFETAWSVLRPFVEAGPDDPRIQSLACQIEARRSDAPLSALPRCMRARDLSATDPAPALMVADQLIRAKEQDQIFPALFEAERRIQALPDVDPRAYGSLATLYRNAASPTRALLAADRAEPEIAAEIREWATELRRRTGVGDGAPLGLDEEHEYFETRFEIDRLLNAKDFTAASTANQTLRSRFPKLPGAELALCEHLLEARIVAKAKTFCQRAAELELDNPRPHQVLGLLAFSKGAAKVAVGHLEKAWRLSQEKKPSWQLLHAALQASGAQRRAAELARDYEARFSEPMPRH